MLFSIIVPIYKVEKYLNKCIDSILEQSFADFELILVDDGSPDSCPQICDAYANRDGRVVVIHKENGGLSVARNVGLERAQGDYIVYLDSDDFFFSNESLGLIAEKTKNNPDVIVYKTAACNQSGEKITFPIMNLEYDCDKTLLHESVSKMVEGEEFQTSAWSKSVRRELLVENDIVFKKGLLGEDIDWYLAVIRCTKSYQTVNEYIYVYRSRPGSITKSAGIKNLTDLIWILKKWDGILGEHSLDMALRHYLGKTYTSLLIMYADISDRGKNQYKKQVKQMNYLLAYDKYHRTRIIKRFYRLLGFDLTIWALAIALRMKTIGEKV